MAAGPDPGRPRRERLPISIARTRTHARTATTPVDPLVGSGPGHGGPAAARGRLRDVDRARRPRDRDRGWRRVARAHRRRDSGKRRELYALQPGRRAQRTGASSLTSGTAGSVAHDLRVHGAGVCRAAVASSAIPHSGASGLSRTPPGAPGRCTRLAPQALPRSISATNASVLSGGSRASSAPLILARF
jgi:hypothetical protein